MDGPTGSARCEDFHMGGFAAMQFHSLILGFILRDNMPARTRTVEATPQPGVPAFLLTHILHPCAILRVSKKTLFHLHFMKGAMSDFHQLNCAESRTLDVAVFRTLPKILGRLRLLLMLEKPWV